MQTFKDSFFHLTQDGKTNTPLKNHLNMLLRSQKGSNLQNIL